MFEAQGSTPRLVDFPRKSSNPWRLLPWAHKNNRLCCSSFGCGSKICSQHGTLANKAKDTNSSGPIPGCFILLSICFDLIWAAGHAQGALLVLDVQGLEAHEAIVLDQLRHEPPESHGVMAPNPNRFSALGSPRVKIPIQPQTQKSEAANGSDTTKNRKPQMNPTPQESEADHGGRIHRTP